MRRVAGVADSATDEMELPPQRAKTGPAGDPGLAARRRWVEENPLKPKPGLSGPAVQVSQKVISKTSERPVCPRVSRESHGFLNSPALTCSQGMTSEGFCSCRAMR
jgi:hypothetical protein